MSETTPGNSAQQAPDPEQVKSNILSGLQYSGNATRVGPSVHMAVAGVAGSKLAWASLFLLVIVLYVWSDARAWNLYESLPGPLAGAFRGWWSNLFSGHRMLHLVLPLVVLGALVARWIVVWQTTRYEIDGDYLVVQHGWLNPRSPGGMLRLYRDPIPLPLVIDCNGVRTITGQFFNSGMLIPKTMDGQVYVLRSVPEPDELSRQIMSKSRVRDIRLMTGTGGG
jgi:hypothetical protein